MGAQWKRVRFEVAILWMVNWAVARDYSDPEIFRNKPGLCNTGAFSVNQFDTKTPLQHRGGGSAICSLVGAHSTQAKTERIAARRRNTGTKRRASLYSPVPLITQAETSELSTNRKRECVWGKVTTKIKASKAATISTSVTLASS